MELLPEKINQLPLTISTKRTLSILAEDDTAGRNKMIKFYSERNAPNFTELLKVGERIEDLVPLIGFEDLGKLIMVEVMKFVKCYNVVRNMTADQAAECAKAIIYTSEEDNLSLQDVVMFFEGAKQGKYGRVLDHLDQHVIFEMFEKYRQERYNVFRAWKDSKEVQNKAYGDTSRMSEVKTEKEFIELQASAYQFEQKMKDK